MNARFPTAMAILMVAGGAARAVPIGDSAELFFTGTVGVRAESNIYLSSTNTSDTIFDIDPGLELSFGQGSATTGTLMFTENFSIYSTHSGLNSDLSTASFTTAYEDGKTHVGFNASYNQLNQNTVDVPASGVGVDALIRRNVLALGASGEVSVTEKTSVMGAFQYENTDYRRAGFSDSQTVTIPFNYYYQLTSKVDVGFGYRYRQTWQQLLLDSRDHFFSLATRGEFTPKLTGSINLGLTQRHFAGVPTTPGIAQNVSLFGVDASLFYAVTPKATMQFGVTHDFDANALGEQEKNFGLRTAFNANVTEEWNFTASLAYRSIDYYSRTDSYFEGQVGATYIVNAKVRITGAVAYRTNDSRRDATETNDSGANRRSFDDTVYSLAASFRF